MKKMVLLLALVLILASAMVPATLAEGGSSAPAMIDLTGLMNAVIAVLGALVTYRLIPWIKARTSESQQGALAACAKTLVYAAEQLYRTGCIQDRLAYVEEGLRRSGYTADRAAIEAAVTQLRADTGAYLNELSIGEIEDEQQTERVGVAEAQNFAPVQADNAAKAAGGAAISAGADANRAQAHGKAGAEAPEESEERQ